MFVDQPCFKERQHGSLPFHSPLVDPPDISAFSSPQSLDRGMLFNDRSLNVTPKESLFIDDVEDDGNPVRGSVESQYKTLMNGVGLRKTRANCKEFSHKQSFLETPKLSEFNDIKTEQGDEFETQVQVAMEIDPEMPVLMAESVENIKCNEGDGSRLRWPEEDGSLPGRSKFSFKSVATVSSFDLQHAACDMPIDLTSPLGRSRRAENGSHLSCNVKPNVSLPVYVTTASAATTAPIYSPISSIGNNSPDHVIDEAPSVSSTSSFLNHFVGYERDSLLQYDPRALYWSDSFGNNFASLPKNVNHSLALLNGSEASACQNRVYESCVPLYMDRPMPDVEDHFASYVQSIFKPRNDCTLNFESLPAQEILSTNIDLSVASETATKARTIGRLLPDKSHMSASQLSCHDFENLTPVRQRRSAAKNHVNHLIDNDIAGMMQLFVRLI